MKNKLQLLILTIVTCFITQSCAKIFYSPQASTQAKSHEILAILPPTVSIAAKRKTDAEAIKEQQKTESLNFQKEMYAWLLKRQMKGQFVCEFQEPEYTNAKLLQAGYPEEPLTTEDICEILQVDGLIRSNFGLSKPVSDGAAIAIAIFGGAAATNEVRINYTISDCESKKIMFSYDHKHSGSLGSSASRLVDALMKKISKKMPHFMG
jgi:hypothetical protein